MASNRRFYEVDVTVLFNGVTCKSLDVKFEKPSECANIRCEYSTGKILVEIPNDCSECVYAIVTCTDDTCAVCNEPQKIKICPCTTSADCAACEKCVNDMCVSVCDEDEFCSSEGICVECDDTVPCPGNQVCVSGKCQCPPDKPFKNDKGICVACDDSHPCPNCTYCTPDGCKPVVCPSGVCNPDTGECVECNGTGDCNKANECCVNNKCDCCTGFKRDYFTGECVPEGCTTDSDCEDCEICYQGKCIPKTCPTGYICVKGDCEPECDCSNATCNKTDACVSAGANKCYCKECKGNCLENSDCGEGCICDGSGKCIPNPCKGGCSNGTDCGPGCGCDGTDCVPCNSYSCNNKDCENILGCDCVGTGCEDVKGCDGPCSSSYDCGPGCTCYQGECVPCADFPCDNNDCSSRPGCACNNGKCDGDGSDVVCTDSFVIEKDDSNCDLVATLVKEEDCSCSKLTISNKVSSVSVNKDKKYGDYLVNMIVDLRKGEAFSLGGVNVLPLLGDTNFENIADNEKPISGVVEVFVTTTYKEVDINGVFVGFNVGPVIKYSATMIDKDTHTFQNIVIQSIGKKVSDILFVHSVDVEIRQATDLVFPNNCVFTGPVSVHNFVITKNDDLEAVYNGNALAKLLFSGYESISSLSARHPMFIWYRSNDGTYSNNNIIRKVYLPANSGGEYVDTLYGLGQTPKGKYPLAEPEGELWSGKYFSVKNDCACDKDADAGKVVFCNPDELFYNLSNCNKTITLLAPFAPCEVNQDITKWESSGYDIPNEVQTKYKFYLNGVLVNTFVHNKNLGMVKDGTSDSMFGNYNFPEPINEIKLVLNHDTSNECTLIYPIVSPDDVTVAKTTNCAISGANYQVTIPKVGTGYTINSMTSSHGTVVSGSNSFILTLPKAVTVTLTYTFSNSCVKVETINEDCCDDFAVTLITTGNQCGGNVNLSYTSVGGQAPFTSVFIYPDGTRNTLNNGSVVVTNPISGTYQVEVTDANGCLSSNSKNVTVNSMPTVTFSGYSNICAGGSTQINILVSADGIGGTLYYTANGSPSNIVIGSGGTASIGPINTSGEYVFNRINVNGCDFNLSDVITIAVIPESNVSVSVDPLGGVICSGSNATFNVSGGVSGCSIELVSGSIVLSTTTFDSLGNASFNVSPTTTTVYTIRVGTCSSSCINGLPFTQTITVVAGPTISITSQTCDVTLTNRTITFDNIDSAVDQLGNNLVVAGNSVTVNPNTVSSITATYDSGTCVVNSSFAVSRCPCPTVTITMPDQVINSGDSAVLTPVVSGGSGSYAYLWSTGQTTSTITVSPTTTTSYTVIVTDSVNGCVYSKTSTVIVVSCSGGIDEIIYQSCACGVVDCVFTFRPTFLSDYAGCKIDEGATNLEYFIDGSGSGTAVDISNGNNLDFIVTLSNPGPCPDPTTIRFAGTIVFLDEIGNSCCDGTSITIDETKSRPGGGWGCTGC